MSDDKDFCLKLSKEKDPKKRREMLAQRKVSEGLAGLTRSEKEHLLSSLIDSFRSGTANDFPMYCSRVG